MVVKMGSGTVVLIEEITYRARTAPPTGENFVLQGHGVAVEHGDGVSERAIFEVFLRGVCQHTKSGLMGVSLR